MQANQNKWIANFLRTKTRKDIGAVGQLVLSRVWNWKIIIGERQQQLYYFFSRWY
jgi:hypothetical protein